MKVYLAGPMGGLSYEQVEAWRSEFAEEVGAEVDCFSPLRDKEHLKGQHLTTGTLSDQLMCSAKGIMRRDYNDVTNANVIVVNFTGVTTPSLGTAMEMMLAFHLHIPLVVISEPDNPHLTHAMIKATVDYRVDTIKEAAYVTQSLLGLNPITLHRNTEATAGGDT